jgi:hypothetical protein
LDGADLGAQIFKNTSIKFRIIIEVFIYINIGVKWMARVLGGALIGVACNVIFYFIPAVNAIAPLLGDILADYYAKGDFEGGHKTGVLMTIFMVIPGILLGGMLGSMFIGAPVIGALVPASTFILTLIIVAHAAMMVSSVQYLEKRSYSDIGSDS